MCVCRTPQSSIFICEGERNQDRKIRGRPILGGGDRQQTNEIFIFGRTLQAAPLKGRTILDYSLERSKVVFKGLVCWRSIPRIQAASYEERWKPPERIP